MTMPTDVDLLPDGRVAVRLVESCGSDLHLSPLEARDLAFWLLRVTMTDLQREVLSNALCSWHSRCQVEGRLGEAELALLGPGPAEDTGDGSSYDDQLTVAEGLEVALGLREAP